MKLWETFLMFIVPFVTCAPVLCYRYYKNVLVSIPFYSLRLFRSGVYNRDFLVKNIRNKVYENKVLLVGRKIDKTATKQTDTQINGLASEINAKNLTI